MAVSKEWVDWTRSRLTTGDAVDDVRAALSAQGFSEKDIKYALKKALPRDLYRQTARGRKQSGQQHDPAPGPDYGALARPRIARMADGHRVVSLCDSGVQLFTVPGFLSGEQCDALIATIRGHAYPSRVDGYERRDAIRSSRTCSLAALDHPFVAGIDRAIASILGLSLGWAEINQGQWYEPGQEYRPHPDYFPPGTPEYDRFARSGGQRTWTFMVYLNDVERGGGTHFTRIDRTVMPERGRALCWNNLTSEGLPNPLTEHAGLPVEAGSKFIITKWFRDRGNGPPLLD